MIARRSLLLASLGTACVRRLPGVESFRLFMDDLPLATANAVPFVPSALEGRVVLVTFIATWCFPCLAEMRVIKRLQRDYVEQGFSNVLVGMDLEGPAVLGPFASGYELDDIPVLVAGDRLRSGETAFGRIRELPSRVLFSREGEVAVAYSGVASYSSLDAVVRKLL